ncbi:MAG TPA: energy transducer TonB [Polyangiaceae bacterium]
MKKLKRQLFAMGSMLVGGSASLAVVFAMNSDAGPPPLKDKEATAEFTVEKRKPPPKPRERPRQQTKTVKNTSAPRAPAPDVASAISGVDFQLPGFEGAAFAGASDELLGETSKQNTMTADVVDDPPKPRHRVQPSYPDQARQRGITGYVTLKLKVTSQGSVDAVRVVEASPRGIFEESAIASIRQWQFDPGVYQGSPVDTWVKQTLRYELN